MRLIKKKKHQRNTKEIIDDLVYGYDVLINQKRFPSQVNRVYAITITHTDTKHEKDLSFTLTNKVFNRLNKDKKTTDHINYLFVIEYSEVISKGRFMPTKCDIHTHIVTTTSIPYENIEKQINEEMNGEVYVDDITNRDDRFNYINYLTKQAKNNLLTTDNYNYKITLY